MKQALPRNNFSSGIISQQLSGRIDLPAFSNGLKNLENFDINLNGSISKRTGYELIGNNSLLLGKCLFKASSTRRDTVFGTGNDFLFIYYIDNTWMFSWTRGKNSDDREVRIEKQCNIREKFEVTENKYLYDFYANFTPDDPNWLDTHPYTINLSGDSYFLKFVFNQTQVYLLEFKANVFRVWISTSDGKLELYKELDEYKEPRVVWFTHPYDLNDLPQIRTSQNFDAIYFCHNKYHPRILSRTYSTTTVTFCFSDVDIATGTGTENPVTEDGYPSCCCFYQQRLFYAGFSKNINKIWASDKGYYDQFTTKRTAREDILDMDGFNFVLLELKLPILWLKETPAGLVLGSAQGIAILKTDSGQLTSFNFGCTMINRDGASPQEPIVVGTTLLYVDSTLKRVKALSYNWNIGGFTSTNLNILCPELIQEPIKKICYQEDEKDFVYVLTNSGDLYYLLYSSSEMFFAWGKIKSYDKFKYIEALEKHDSGTNLFLIDTKNNILKKSKEIILKSQEEYYTQCINKAEVHNLYYDYLKRTINDFNYLDYSTQINYFNTTKLTFTKTEEIKINEQEKFIFGYIYNSTIQDLSTYLSQITEQQPGRPQPRLNPEPDGIFIQPTYVLKTWLIEDRDRLTLYEIQEIITYDVLKVKVLSNNYSNNIEIYNWTFKKNLLDGIDTNIYPVDTKWTIVGDGYYFNDMKILEGGKIQLDPGITMGQFRIGHSYTSYLKTMNLGGMIDTQNTMISKKNISKVYARLYNSWGGKFGTDYFDLKDINYLTLENARFDEPYTLQDMDVKLDVTDKWEYNKNYYIVQNVPYPFNMNSITILTDYNN